jgi:hypothetical protein
MSVLDFTTGDIEIIQKGGCKEGEINHQIVLIIKSLQ